MTYGDGLTNSDINRSIKFHKANEAIATVTAVKAVGRFGELGLQRETVTAFTEKPDMEGGFISGGYFVFNKAIADLLDNDHCVLEREPLETLARRGQLKAWRHDGFWQCMDTFREQEMLNKLWIADSAPWKLW